MTELDARLDRIEAMLEQIICSMGAGSAAALPPDMSHQDAHLIALARNNPAASIAEAKRLSRLETARRRRAKQ